jgi:hypothetical protein
MYASDSKQFGVEGAILYKLNQNVLVGPDIIYFDKSIYVGTVNATFQLPIHPLPEFWPTFEVTPLLVVGSGTSWGSKTTIVIGEAETGFATTLWASKNGYVKVGLDALAGKITNIEGPVYKGGPFLNVNF